MREPLSNFVPDVAYFPVVQFIGENFGEFAGSSSLYDGEYIRFWTLRPVGGEFCVISTFGLGMFRFLGRRREYFMVLPGDWDTQSDHDRWDWPMAVLAHVCSDVTDGEAAPAGTIYPFQGSFADNTRLCSAMVAEPRFLQPARCTLENGEAVEFLQLIPIYEEEIPLLAENTDLAAPLLANRGMVDINRVPLT